MTNYDKSLDSIAKDQKKAKFQAKKKAAAQATKKAKIAKGGKGGAKRGQVGKNRNNAPVKPAAANRRRGPPRGAKNGAAPKNAGAKLAKALRAQVPKGGIKSASALAKRGGINTGLKVHVDNLDFGVTEKDMRELFGEFGGLKTVQMHFNAQGKSQGVCDIHFKNKQDGLRAVKKYNNVPLDGRRMKIDVIGQPGAGGAAPAVSKIQAAKAAAKKRVSPVKKQQQKKQVGKASPNKQSPKKKLIVKKKGGAAGKKGPAKKGGEAKKKAVTEEDLDKQLDAYLAAGAI